MSTWLATPDVRQAFVDLTRREPWTLMVHDRLRRELLKRFPRAQWEIWILCAALEEGVFLDVSSPAEELSTQHHRDLVHVLVQRVSASHHLASWAITTLAEAFGKRCQPGGPAAISSIEPVPLQPEGAQLKAGLIPRDSYPVAAISAGEFAMGLNGPNFSSDSLAATRSIIPPCVPHDVTISKPFFMGIGPVTQGYWRHVMGRPHSASGIGSDDHPVTGVDFMDALSFCNQASTADGLEQVYSLDEGQSVGADRSANGWRLPTEAEWEYCCRAGSQTRFCFGGSLHSDQANFDGQFEGGRFRGLTTPVGLFAANDWGLYDVHGNVHEWCWDWSETLGPEAAIDPEGPPSGTYRIVRGGAWTLWRSAHCGSATRMAFRPDMPGFDCGFRMVRD